MEIKVKKYIMLLFNVLVICLLSACKQDDSYRNFKQARQDVSNYFSENKNLLEENKDLILKKHSSEGITIDKIINISYANHLVPPYFKESADVVVFMCGNYSMAMYWGQDWGIYYTSQDVPINTLYVDSKYDEIREVTNDNKTYFWINQNPDEKRRYCVSERIAKNWFFYYNNWEGDPSILREHFDDDDTYGINWHKNHGF